MCKYWDSMVAAVVIFSETGKDIQRFSRIDQRIAFSLKYVRAFFIHWQFHSITPPATHLLCLCAYQLPLSINLHSYFALTISLPVHSTHLHWRCTPSMVYLLFDLQSFALSFHHVAEYSNLFHFNVNITYATYAE